MAGRRCILRRLGIHVASLFVDPELDPACLCDPGITDSLAADARSTPIHWLLTANSSMAILVEPDSDKPSVWFVTLLRCRGEQTGAKYGDSHKVMRHTLWSGRCSRRLSNRIAQFGFCYMWRTVAVRGGPPIYMVNPSLFQIPEVSRPIGRSQRSQWSAQWPQCSTCTI